MRFSEAIRGVKELAPVPGIRMCDASFRVSKAITAAGEQRIGGVCRLCQQQIGTVVVGPGLVRINWHERRPIRHEAMERAAGN
jgi:hypothetical protein